MQYYTEIEVAQKEVAILNSYLKMTGAELYNKYGLCKDETKTYTAEFVNGFFADITVTIADDESTPYIDPVLYDESGYEVQVLDVCDAPLEGEYEFFYQENDYIVNLVVK